MEMICHVLQYGLDGEEIHPRGTHQEEAKLAMEQQKVSRTVLLAIGIVAVW